MLWCALLAAKQPRSLTAARLGVGACLWDGAFVLTAYLLTQPSDTFTGKRCIELGAGVGLVGLSLARLGAEVTLTDKPALLSLLKGNVARNWLGERAHPGADPGLPRGKADVAALEWGSKDCTNTVAALASKQYDYVVATDCTYIDPDGNTPDDNHFMTACAGLCHKQTTCFITFEDRGSALRNSFLAAAHAKFTFVKEISRGLLPPGYQMDHIDLWELRL
ncbi:hypothetical protein ABBQ32_005634 [Trebouxia sp. C0010 RCD-2024]